MSQEVIRRTTAQAQAIAADGKLPVAVEYQTPNERAGATLQRNLIAGAAAVAVALLPGALVFLQTGDFSHKALQAFGISTLTAVVMLVLNWAQKLQQAKADDARYPADIAPPRNPEIVEIERQGVARAARMGSYDKAAAIQPGTVLNDTQGNN